MGTDLYLGKAAIPGSLRPFFSQNRYSESQLLTQTQLTGISSSSSFCANRTGLWPDSEKWSFLLHIHQQSAAFNRLKLIDLQNSCFLCSKSKPCFGVGLVLLLINSFAKPVSLSSEPQKLSCNTLTKLRHYLEFCN